MTRCKEFYDKVERDGFDWCEKDKGTVSRINSYLKVVNELLDEGIEKKLTYGNFSENASRPLNKIEDPAIRGEVITLISKSIARGDQPSEADVKVWIDLASGIDPVVKKEKEPIAQTPITPPVPPTTPTAATVAAIAHVPEEKVIQTYTPAKPIERTDPNDKANGVVRMKHDYELRAAEGQHYPISKLKAQVMNQMVDYELAADNLDANALYDKHGPDYWLTQVDILIAREEALGAEA